jgi:4-hydroxybenzoate polyprenyltransferase
MNSITYPLSTKGFWKAYWITMRPYLLFVSGVAGMAGFAAGPETNLAATVSVFLVFFLSYGFGQALTDCFQTDTDSISSPYRPLVQGVISRKQVLFVSLGSLTIGCLALLLLNPRIIIPGLLCITGLTTYTYFKRRWWGGPFYNAWIVSLLPLIGFMAAAGTNSSIAAILRNNILMSIIISVFFSYANFVLMGYFKDISADRASGYNTFVVVYGWKKAATGSDVLAILSIAATGRAVLSALESETVAPLSWIAIPIFFAAVLVLILAQIGIHRTRDEKEAFRPIANVVRGFVLLHLSEICLLQPSCVVVAILFYLTFELTLKTRPEKGQV